MLLKRCDSSKTNSVKVKSRVILTLSAHSPKAPLTHVTSDIVHKTIRPNANMVSACVGNQYCRPHSHVSILMRSVACSDNNCTTGSVVDLADKKK